jgi:hypothetical protein
LVNEFFATLTANCVAALSELRANDDETATRRKFTLEGA